jgi:hypothetical protein
VSFATVVRARLEVPAVWSVPAAVARSTSRSPNSVVSVFAVVPALTPQPM